MDILKALKGFNQSIESLTDARKQISNRNSTIDEAVKKEIEEQKKKAEDLLKRI